MSTGSQWNSSYYAISNRQRVCIRFVQLTARVHGLRVESTCQLALHCTSHIFFAVFAPFFPFLCLHYDMQTMISQDCEMYA